jgi:serine/threonine-protein kinase
VSTEAPRGIKKRCPLCAREFVGTIVVCTHDNSLLVPVKESLVGKTLASKYLVLEEVGRGGMSIVYKGRHSMIDRMVAIKMLQSQLLNDQNSVKRFQREAQAVACINHPNVIAVYDCDIHEGQPYIVMDFLTGESLSNIIKRDNHVDFDRVIKMFIKVTDALESAHQKGVLHRDLKSGNIMLIEQDGQKDVVKVVDFGIAKLLPSSGKQQQNLTATGEIFGSPVYMSPEQCQGLQLDARSDIYSTGVVMYEALCGEPPLIGENIIDTMQMHVSKPPIPFPQIRPDLSIPPVLEAIVLKALEKQPDDRFQSMLELREALEYAEKSISENGAIPRAGGRPARTTRQGMNSERPPNSLPKPILVGPDGGSSQRGARSENSSTKLDPVAEQRRSSSKNPGYDHPGTRQSAARMPRLESGGEPNSGLTSFRISDVEKYQTLKRARPVLLWLAAIILVLVVLGVLIYLRLRPS